MKTQVEIRAKLEEMLSLNTIGNKELTFSKIAACKALLWALGINDDDRWYIRAAPGPPIDDRVKDRD
jgi:hypothetical protein